METVEDKGDALYNLACRCEALFDAQLAAVKEQQSPLSSLIAEYQQRFAIWTAYLGVFARRSQSLDTRLQNHPDMQDLVARLLDLLRRSLQRVVRPTEIKSEINALRIGDDVRETVEDDNNEALAAVEATLTRLNKLGVTIRQSSRDRIDVRVKRFAANLDLTPFDAASRAAVQTLYPKAHPSLREYLSKTMTDRYASMLFTQHRGSTLKSRRPESSFDPMPAIGEETEAPSASRDSTVQESDRVPNSPAHPRAPAAVSRSDLSTVNSFMLGQALSKFCNFEADNMSQRGASSVQVSQASYPRPPSGKGNNFYACEFCTRAIDMENISERDWRRHIDEDLKPYTCISEECPGSHPAYPNFSSWFQHMTRCHGMRWHQRLFLTPSWVCAICDNSGPISSYTSPEEIHLHLTQTHGDPFSESMLHAISRQSKVERPRQWTECPICCFAVEEVRAPDKPIPPKRRGEQLRRGRDKIPTRTPNLEFQKDIPGESSSGNWGDSSDDYSEDADENTLSDNAEIMARHIAAHLQGLMLLTIRLAAVQGEQWGSGDGINSASVDIGDSEAPSRGRSAMDSKDTSASSYYQTSNSSDGTSDHAHMAQDDADVPDVDVDFYGVRRQYDELAVEEDAFLQGLVSSGAFQSHMTLHSPRLEALSDFRPFWVVGAACRWCHYKKRKCHSNLSNLNGACRNCADRPGLCYRYSLSKVSLYLEKDAPSHLLSKRWNTMDLVDIKEWASDEVLTIEVDSMYVHAPLTLRVRKFIPREGDMLESIWYVDREERVFAVPPYAIVSMADAAGAIDILVSRSASALLYSMPQSGEDYLHNCHLRETYDYARKYYEGLQDEMVASLMHKTLSLWVACHLTSRLLIFKGYEALGIPEMMDPSSPYPAPPVLVAQLECIVHTKLLRPLSREILYLLDSFFKRRARDVWMAVYLVTFVMVHNCAILTGRDHDLARKLNLETKYANPEAVAGLHKGATTLLAHYHLIVGGPAPIRLAGTSEHKAYTKWRGFTEEDEQFMIGTNRLIKSMDGRLRADRESRNPGKEFYWLSQLYDEDWSPDELV